MKIIAGLGNPGKKYDRTRHNIGFAVIDALADNLGLTWKEDKKLKAHIAEGQGFILVKPLVFMNESGLGVAPLLRYYQLLPRTIFGTKKDADLSSALTVIHDELDLPFGTYKVSVNSRPAGHNGIKSLVAHLKTQNFRRLRIGINTENRRELPTAAFVLQKFSPEELKALPGIIQKAIESLNSII